MTDRQWWTEDRVEELKARWANNETGTEICLAMHAASRNAVVGKVYRLGLVKLTRPPRSKQRRIRHPAVLRPVKIGNRFEMMEQVDSMIDEPPPPLFGNPKRFGELGPHECRFPGVGDGADPDLLFCAAPIAVGYPYCPRHCALAYVKPTARVKAPPP